MTGTAAGEAAGRGKLFLAALLAITLIGPMSVHFFLPAMPDIRRDFDVPTGVAQLTFSLALLAMALATLFFGSLSDRYGRRPVLLCGLALFTLGALLSMMAPTIELLIFGRIVQGAGAACGVVLSRAIVRDIYGVERLAQMIAYLTAAYVLGPMLGPPIGGALVDAFGWRAVAVAAALVGVLVFALSFRLIKETRAPHAASLARGIRLLAGYRRLLGSARFTLFALQPGLATATFFTHGSATAFLMAEVLHRPASEYGLIFAFGPGGFLVGNFISGRIGSRVGRSRMVVGGSAVTVCAVILLAALIEFDGMTPLNLFLPAFFLTLGQGFAMPHSQAAAIATDMRLTGTASGIVVFLQFFLGAVLSIGVGYLADGTATPMIAIMLAASMLSFTCGASAVWLDRRAARAGVMS